MGLHTGTRCTRETPLCTGTRCTLTPTAADACAKLGGSTDNAVPTELGACEWQLRSAGAKPDSPWNSTAGVPSVCNKSTLSNEMVTRTALRNTHRRAPLVLPSLVPGTPLTGERVLPLRACGQL